MTPAARRYFDNIRFHPSDGAEFFSAWGSIFLSGGLHADGWMDCSDAYFSYRDQQRRLEIMSDPRVGAVAVLSLFFLLGFRFIFMFETIAHFSLFSLFCLPLLSRLGMTLLLLTAPLAKQTGMASSFRQHVDRRFVPFVHLSHTIRNQHGCICAPIVDTTNRPHLATLVHVPQSGRSLVRYRIRSKRPSAPLLFPIAPMRAHTTSSLFFAHLCKEETFRESIVLFLLAQQQMPFFHHGEAEVVVHMRNAKYAGYA